MGQNGSDRTALVLSGGGARGAYEAGLVAGIVEILGLEEKDPPPWRMFAGTSVGAINGTFLASRADRGDLGVAELVRLWSSLEMEEFLRVDPLVILQWFRGGDWLRRQASRFSGRRDKRTLGRSILDAEPLERILKKAILWDRLRENIDSGAAQALFVAALHLSSGGTTVFAELAPGVVYRPSRDPTREAFQQKIGIDQVLASAAIPVLFPARKVGAFYYCDGGLRFNTPISPALRSGAKRLIVVSLRHDSSARSVETPDLKGMEETLTGFAESYPDPVFLLGKVLDALLLDPIVHDLQTLRRINRLVETLEKTLAPDQFERLQKVFVETRGSRYHKIETLFFSPSVDIGVMAAEHLAKNLGRWRVGYWTRWLLRRMSSSVNALDSDLASYVLFDGEFAAALVELGRKDARCREAGIRRFFGSGGRTAQEAFIRAPETSQNA